MRRVHNETEDFYSIEKSMVIKRGKLVHHITLCTLVRPLNIDFVPFDTIKHSQTQRLNLQFPLHHLLSCFREGGYQLLRRAVQITPYIQAAGLAESVSAKLLGRCIYRCVVSSLNDHLRLLGVDTDVCILKQYVSHQRTGMSNHGIELIRTRTQRLQLSSLISTSGNGLVLKVTEIAPQVQPPV